MVVDVVSYPKKHLVFEILEKFTFYAVSIPQILCSQKMAVFGIVLISVLCFIVNTPHFGSHYAIPDADRDAGAPAYDVTEFGKGKGSQLYEFWVHCMFLVLVPWIIILSLNLMIICRVTKLNK